MGVVEGASTRTETELIASGLTTSCVCEIYCKGALSPHCIRPHISAKSLMVPMWGRSSSVEAFMPKEVHNQLSAVTVRSESRRGRYADGNGLYLVVSETGARQWLWRGMVHGRRRDIGIGPARLVPLKDAREIARRWRLAAREGSDPAAERDKARRRSLTFEEAARKVHTEQIEPHNRNRKHNWQWLRQLELHAFPTLGSLPVHAIRQADVLRVLAPIWTETPETARRLLQRIRTVLDWSIAAGHREAANPVPGVEKGLPRQKDKVKHHDALPWAEAPALMQRLVKEEGMGAIALRFAILTAARSGEVRGATWQEIDLEAATWTIPAGRMKAGTEHRVPLSAPAMALLRGVKGLSPTIVFPSPKSSPAEPKPLSDMTLLAVLRRLKVEAVPHGFRSTFRDWTEEATHYAHEVKEAALAHTVKNRTEAACRRSDLFEKRREMMDAWAAYATGEAAKVVRIRA
jgi:integrase